jgi:hypothetical protein
MSIEDKLKHLKDYMAIWIDVNVNNRRNIERLFYYFNEFGILLPTKGLYIAIPSFEEYIKIIENQQHISP